MFKTNEKNRTSKVPEMAVGFTAKALSSMLFCAMSVNCINFSGVYSDTKVGNISSNLERGSIIKAAPSDERVTEEETTEVSENNTDSTSVWSPCQFAMIRQVPESNTVERIIKLEKAPRIKSIDPVEVDPSAESEVYKTVYASGPVNVRVAPSSASVTVRVMSDGESVDVVAETDNEWYKTVDGNYIKTDLMTENPSALPVVDSTSDTDPTEPKTDLASFCLQYVGCNYIYAGSSPESGFDCSGFVSYVYSNYYGIQLPHSADSIYQMGTEVSSEEMIPGDIVCNDHDADGYIDHVSIYIGDGTVVHASSSTTGVITSLFSELKDVTSIRRLV